MCENCRAALLSSRRRPTTDRLRIAGEPIFAVVWHHGRELIFVKKPLHQSSQTQSPEGGRCFNDQGADPFPQPPNFSPNQSAAASRGAQLCKRQEGGLRPNFGGVGRVDRNGVGACSGAAWRLGSLTSRSRLPAPEAESRSGDGGLVARAHEHGGI